MFLAISKLKQIAVTKRTKPRRGQYWGQLHSPANPGTSQCYYQMLFWAISLSVYIIQVFVALISGLDISGLFVVFLFQCAESPPVMYRLQV